MIVGEMNLWIRIFIPWQTSQELTFWSLDIYGPVFGQSAKVDQLFSRLKDKIGSEIHFQQKSFELLGSLDILFAAAISTSSFTTDLDEGE